MIVNSHLEDLYPARWMAADGLIGQCIFFFLAGYGMAKSFSKQEQSFLKYYSRRISRIYPALIPAVLFLVYIPKRGWENWGIAHYLREFAAPKEFGFIQFIMVYYLGMWLLFRFKKKILATGIAMVLCMLACLIIFVLDPIRKIYTGTTIGNINGLFYWFFFGLMTLMGCFIGLDCQKKAQCNLISRIFYVGLIFVIYVGLKLALYKGWQIPYLEWYISSCYILLFALMLPFTYLLFDILAHDNLIRYIGEIKWLSLTCAILSGATLEIYITHGIAVGAVKPIKFPLNLIVYYPIMLVIGCITKLISDKLRSLMHLD